MLEQNEKAGQRGRTVGSPGRSDIFRENQDSPKSEGKAKTEVAKGSTELYKYEPAQENIRGEGFVEGIMTNTRAEDGVAI